MLENSMILQLGNYFEEKLVVNKIIAAVIIQLVSTINEGITEVSDCSSNNKF